MSRRQLRDELERSWNVYDARRPITKHDFAATVCAADGAGAISPPDDPLVESAAPTGAGGCVRCVRCVQCARARDVRTLIVCGAAT